ncbi:uncharacterized protein METZ01_LOCUS215245, partial [marine metagenome]
VEKAVVKYQRIPGLHGHRYHSGVIQIAVEDAIDKSVQILDVRMVYEALMRFRNDFKASVFGRSLLQGDPYGELRRTAPVGV